MAFQPKTEPGSLSVCTSTTHKTYKVMSISELVSVLRVAYQVDDFDKVEEELVNRDAKFKVEIGPLREKIEVERLKRIEAEEKLKKREEQCEKGKRAQENYEKLLKEVKKNGLVEKNTIEELRKKNLALERENCDLKELKEKWLDDGKSVAELRIKIRVLEEAMKKNLTVTEGLRTENSELADKKRRCETLIESLESKFRELSVRVVKLEDDTKLLMSEDASGFGNTDVEPDPGVTYAVNDEEDGADYELENDTGGPVPVQRNEDTRHSLDTGMAQSPSKGNKEPLGTSAGEKLKLENVVEIIDLDDDDDDDDDVGFTSQGLHGKKAISQIVAKNEHPSSSDADAVQHKRKYVSAIGTSTSTSSSSADTFNIDNLPRAIACEKRSKTLADNSGLNSLPR
ncbi:hypothetical protein E2542_SST21831 [Spatholobus suberectus]|nr:hypothetical protein E2542_SST21831 [Spatholobus suberectus]